VKNAELLKELRIERHEREDHGHGPGRWPWIAGGVLVVVLAAGALILPLSKVVPPLYVWRIRSRVYRWYGQLRSVEQGVDEGKPREELLHRLDQIEERVNRLTVPLSFADEFYGLRNHIEFVRQKLRTNT